MIHVRSSEASLTTLPGLAISIRHKELGVLVAPPLALSGDRADLLGDDALLVGQTYVCEVSRTSTLTRTLTQTLTLTPTLTLTLTQNLTLTLTQVSEHPALLPSHVEFTVQAQPAQVALTLERAPQTVSLVFRALGGGMGDGRPEPFAVGSGAERRVSVSSAEHGRSDEELPRTPGAKRTPKLERSRSGRSSAGSRADGGRGDGGRGWRRGGWQWRRGDEVMVAIDLWGACSERTVLMTWSGGDGGVSGERIEGDSGRDEPRRGRSWWQRCLTIGWWRRGRRWRR